MSEATQTMFNVVRPGLLSTVQDRGRWGYQRYGVPVAGAMDQWSLLVANRLVGNPEWAAALEVTVVGPTLEVTNPGSIAISGANLSPRINGEPVRNWETIQVDSGDTISFGECRSGCRAYIAVAGGIAVDPVLGSRATDLRSGLGGFEGRALEKGDVLLRYAPPVSRAPYRRLAPRYHPIYGPEFELRVVDGPQLGMFCDSALAAFLGTAYTVMPASDRMGIRLHGQPMHYRGSSMLSDDRQSTGGSPKVATVITPDLGLTGQLRPGDRVWFSRIEHVVARRLASRFLRALYGRSEGRRTVLR